MIVYFSMTKKKNRKEKMKGQVKREGLSYTFSGTKNELKNETNAVSANLELKKILLSTATILAFNVILYVLFVTGTLKLGFLGY